MFDFAKSQREIAGVLKKGNLSVYVSAELGKEKDYIPSDNDNPRTEYRYFYNCKVYIHESKKDLEEGYYTGEPVYPTSVIIYC